MNIYKNTIALILFLTILLVFAVSSLSFAEYYKYTGKDGKISFTDDLSKIPVDQRKNLKAYESSNTYDKNAVTKTSKDKILYYDKETDYKIILSEGFLLGITKSKEGYEMFSEIGNFPEDYPKNFPAPGTHIDR